MTTHHRPFSNLRRPDQSTVMLWCAEAFNVTPDQMRAEGRVQAVVMARFIFAYLMRRIYHLSLKQVADLLHRKHHGAIMHAERAIDALLSTNDPIITTHLATIEHKIHHWHSPHEGMPQ